MPENVDANGNFISAPGTSGGGFSLFELPVRDAAPPPIDPESATRAEEQHQAYLRSINEHQPGNLYFRRPDLAAQARERAEKDMADLRMRHGISAPVPKSAAEIAEERFEHVWRGPPELSDSTYDMIDVELERLEANGADHARGVADLKKEFGEEGYAKLIAQAKTALNPGEAWRPAIEASRPVLRLLASYGRYGAAYDAARSKLPK